MKKRAFIRIMGYGVSLVGILVAMTLISYSNLEQYKRRVENSYMSSLSQLTERLSNIESSLKKAIYVTSPSTFSLLATDVWQDASSAKVLIATLPLQGVNLDKTSKFISQAGEYSLSLLEKTSSGEQINEQERQNIRSLSVSAQSISAELSTLKSKINTGEISLEDVLEKLSAQNNNSVPANANTASSSSENSKDDYTYNLQGNFPEYASLIYDGPYSDHIEALTPIFLEGKSELTGEQLAKKAADILDTTPENIVYTDGSHGKIKTACFSLSSNGENSELEITRIGGYILNYSKSRTIADAKLSVDEAIKFAKQKLTKVGFNSLKESYYTIFKNRITVNFAYTQDNVICYPDLIKVSVALDNGEIVGMETYGYLMNHKERELSTIDISEEQAKSIINSQLEILSTSLALTPTDGHNEVLCYEVKTLSPEDTHYIIYVNTKTGVEENIFILIEDENGILTI